MQIELHFGTLSDPLQIQLNRQLPKEMRVTKADMHHAQLDMEAIVRLRVRRLLTNAQGDYAEKKLFKKITAIVENPKKRAPKRKTGKKPT